MDFTIRKPLHLFALCLLILTFLLIIILPIFSFFGFGATTSDYLQQLEEFPESYQILLEVITLLLQLLLVIGLFIVVPFLWYFLVNHLSLKDMLSRLQLKKEKIELALLWGAIAAVVISIIVIGIGIVVTTLGFDLENSSNLQDIEVFFSPASILILVLFQPITEEIFFRGFLLEKITSLTNAHIAIIVTAILFGIAHLSYNKAYPAFMIALIGIILGYLVVKTRNLSTAIFAHIFFNLFSFTIYLIGKSLGF
jgi:hypothetical protein